MKIKLFLNFMFLSCLKVYASEPISACRVMTSSLLETVKLSNNAGCVITRKNKLNKLEVLMILTNKDGGGYAFPGGKSATFDNDLKEVSKKKNTKAKGFVDLAYSLGKNQGISHINYAEPVACSAARETKEETGLDVIVGELLAKQKKYLAFRCYAPEGQTLEALDKVEVRPGSFKWISKADYLKMKDAKKGSTKDRFVYTNNEILKIIFQ